MYTLYSGHKTGQVTVESLPKFFICLLHFYHYKTI